MKRRLLVLLALLLCLPMGAPADTLALDLEAASQAELQAAQRQIAERISALRAADAAPGDTIVLTGSGSAILAGVVVEQIPARVTISGAVRLTLTGGAYDHTFNYDKNAAACQALTEAATYDALVEGTGDWRITIEPLQEGGAMAISGTGAYVSDLFALPSATIVQYTLDASHLKRSSALLYLAMGHQNGDAPHWMEDRIAGGFLLSPPLALEGEAIARPTENRAQYYWVIEAPEGAAWALTAVDNPATASLVKPETDSAAAMGLVRITSSGTVNLRAEGHAESALVGRASPGDTFPYLGDAPSGWHGILLPDGRTGYVSPKLSAVVE
jgi:hypothetical protein